VRPGFTTFPLYYKEVSLIGSRALRPRTWRVDRARRLGRVDVGGFATRPIRTTARPRPSRNTSATRADLRIVIASDGS
jgi:hypothetical protein